jgi:hypothetical protein
MVAVLDELDLTGLVISIDGLTAVGAAAILTETGDLVRFGSPRAVVKHAGLCPRDNTSGQHQGKTSISGKGRPGLRLAAWRAVWAALPNNRVLAARFTHLTTREHNRLARQQGPHGLRRGAAALAARPRHRTGALGSGHRRRRQTGQPRRLTVHSRLNLATASSPGGASPNVPRGTHLAHEHGQPRRLLHQLDCTLSGPTRLSAR